MRPFGLVEEDGFEPSKLTQQIYSLPPLATREFLLINGAGNRNRTYNLLITSQLLYLLSYASIITTRCILTFASLSVKNFLKLFISLISFTVVSLSAISIYHESFFDASIFFKFFKLHSFLIGKKI